MHSYIGILDNSTTWKTREGDILALEDMSPSHRQNVMVMLERRVHRFKPVADMSMALSMALMEGPSGDMAQNRFDQELEDQLNMTPLEWLKKTNLYLRLEQLNTEYWEETHA